MADNVTFQSATPATPPSGTVVSSDEATGTGAQIQRVKIAYSADGAETHVQADADGMLVNLGANNDVTVAGVATSAKQDTAQTTLDAIKTAVEVIDNFISATRGLVTEDNSAAILTAVQTIDNFISGSRGLVTEDNSAAILTALQTIDNFISGSRGLVTEDNSAAALTALQLIDDTVATAAAAITAKGFAMAGTDGTNARIVKTDTSGELQVDVLSSALPSGASTAANQATIIGHIDGVEGLLTTIDADTGTLAGAVAGTEMQVDIVSAPAIATGNNVIGQVKITDGTDVALVDASGNLMVNVAAGGAGDGSILDGVSSSIKATVLDYTNSNPLAVRLTDTNGDYVGAGAGTQYTEDAAAAADPVGTMAMAVRADTPAAVTTTDGDNIALRATNKGELYVKQSDAVSVTGTVTANLAAGTNNIGDVDVLTLPALPAGTNNIGDVDILSIAAGDNNIGNVDIVTMPNVTNAGTFATQDSQVIADNAGFTDGTSKVFTAGYIYDEVAGTALTENDAAAARINVNRAQVGIIEDGATRGRYATVTASNAVKVDASGVAVPVTDNSGSLTVDAPVGTPVFVRLSDGAAAISTLPVSLASVPSHAVTNAGTFAVQESGSALTALQVIDNPVVVDDAAFTPATTSVMMAGFEFDDTTPDSVNEGDAGAARMSANRNQYVQIRDNAGNERGLNIDASGQIAVTLAASQTLATVTTVGTVTTLTGGGVAHDSADSGNPVKVGAKASATLSDDTMVANADRIDLTGDLDGALYVRNVPLGDLIFEAVSDTGGTSTAFTNFGATASTRSYITSVTAFRTDSGTTMAYIDFRDGTAGSVIYRIPLPPSGGVTISNAGAPLFYTTANTALAYDVSAALTTVYISVTGFKSKARA